MRFVAFLFFLWLCPMFIQSQSLNEDQVQRIDEIFAQFNGKPGCAVGIYEKGEIAFKKGYGIANMDDDIPITPKTIFETASLSKQFTASCIALLEIEGKLNFDDPANKYLPELQEYPEGQVTIRHLLHHTSGFRDYLKVLFMSGEGWDTDFDNMEALNLVARQSSLNFKPGEKHTYSNSGYLILSLIVERISGQSMDDFAQTKIFEPLGMHNSFFYQDKTKIVKNRAIGYTDEEDELKMEHYHNFTATGDGGVCTNLEDMFKWSENLKENKLGDDSFLSKMGTTGILNNGDTIDYAFGLIKGNRNGHATLGHSGHWGGFNSLIMKYPDLDLSFVILSNSATTNVWGLFSQMLEVINPSSPVTESNNPLSTVALPPTMVLSTAQLDQHTGLYFNGEAGYSRKIDLINDTLYYNRLDGRSSPLAPINENRFFMIGAPHVEIHFEETNNKLHEMNVQVGTEIYNHFRYEINEYNAQELKNFEGCYYSDDLDLKYNIVSRKHKLCIEIDGEELVCLDPAMKNTFNDLHFGYIVFNELSNQHYDSFTFYDEHVNNVRFAKVKE